MSVTLEPASLRGEVAQLVEHTAENRGVAGSIPALAIVAATDVAARVNVAAATDMAGAANCRRPLGEREPVRLAARASGKRSGDAGKKGRPGRCYRAANVLVHGSLIAVALAGKQRGADPRLEVRKVREAAGGELSPQRFRPYVDRRRRAT